MRQIKKLEKKVQQEILTQIEKLTENPRPFGVEKLEATEKLFRIRVGPGRRYRVIYQIRDEDPLIVVAKVGHRKEIYRKL